MLGVLERKLNTQDNQILQQLCKNPQYNYDHEKNLNEHKLLELKEKREVHMIELNCQKDLEHEKLGLKAQKDKQEEELHNGQHWKSSGKTTSEKTKKLNMRLIRQDSNWKRHQNRPEWSLI
ncbi:hypothetical protein O181_008911 [Austropuccinia psidii MF-1]|uniref:Uncharacterized protein n=1 Tax=Austropuccinia psidii MF-1 TaxID=1389203 RepID=A0A9Q3GIZ3_9BASI|nr:hypothetical protein [Austropuccinia psidii MF-1]